MTAISMVANSTSRAGKGLLAESSVFIKGA